MYFFKLCLRIIILSHVARACQVYIKSNILAVHVYSKSHLLNIWIAD